MPLIWRYRNKSSIINDIYIRNKLRYSYKKVYAYGVEKDEQYLKEIRLWITHTFFLGDFLAKYFVVWMDETGINSDSYKKMAYSEKSKQKNIYVRP